MGALSEYANISLGLMLCLKKDGFGVGAPTAVPNFGKCCSKDLPSRSS